MKRYLTALLACFALLMGYEAMGQWQSTNETYSNAFDGEWTTHEAQVTVNGLPYWYARLFLRCVDGERLDAGFRFRNLVIHPYYEDTYAATVDVDVKFGDAKPKNFTLRRPARGKRLIWDKLKTLMDASASEQTMILRLQWRDRGYAPTAVDIAFPMAGSSAEFDKVLKSCDGKRSHRKLAKRLASGRT